MIVVYCAETDETAFIDCSLKEFREHIVATTEPADWVTEPLTWNDIKQDLGIRVTQLGKPCQLEDARAKLHLG